MAFSKPRRELEPRWVSQYAAWAYPKNEVRMRVPLGPIPQETSAQYGLMKGLRVYRPWRPECDLAVRLPEKIVLIEAKIFKYMDGLSKLPVYASLLPSTPELAFWPKTVEMVLLIPAKIEWVRAAAVTMGVKVVSDYVPDYIKSAWDERDKYWTRDALQAREERKRKMAEAGIT